MSASHPEHVHKSIKTYWKVFAALTIGTVLTVAAARFHMPVIAAAIGIAVLIALVKGSLVAGYFMHLFSEKRLIYAVLALTAVFFIALIALVMWTHSDQQGHQHGVFAVPARPPHTPHAEEPHVP
jgi:cytochrome c oxidase subunit 4